MTSLKRLAIVLGLVSVTVQADPVPVQHWINTGLNNRDLTISPDGHTLLSTIMSPTNRFAVILVSHQRDGKWSAPEIAPFSGTWPDIEPMFTPDGKRLYFASKRPKPDRDSTDWDIWSVTFDQGRWSEPDNPGPPINSAGNEFYPSITSGGSLYFTAERESDDPNIGGEDIWRALPDPKNPGQFLHAEPVPGAVNTKQSEFNAFISADDDFLIFGATGRDNEMGGGDLYISRADANGQFGPGILLPAPINSPSLDYCPYIRGDSFYFTSQRPTDNKLAESYETLKQAYESPGNGLGDIYSVPTQMLE